MARVREGRFQIFDYGLDRSTRILIPLIPACLFAVAVAFFLSNNVPSAGQVVANMVGLNEVVTESLATNAVLWSLAYENGLIFLLVPIAFMLLHNGTNAASILTIIACVIVFTILKAHYLIFWMLGAYASLLVETRFKRTSFVIGIVLLLAGSFFHQLAADSRSVTSVAYIPPLAAEFLVCIGIAMTLPLLRYLVRQPIIDADRSVGRGAGCVFIHVVSYPSASKYHACQYVGKADVIFCAIAILLRLARPDLSGSRGMFLSVF